MKTFLKVLGFILVLGLGFGIGYRYAHYKNPSKPVVAVQEESKPSTEMNKFFEFFNTYTIEKDMGNPRIEFAYLNEGLMLFSYPTSQETAEFGIYDYRNDVIYKGVGPVNGYEEYYNVPVAFLDRDTIIVFDTGSGSGKLSIVNYRTKEVKKAISINIPQGYYLHESEPFPMGNSIKMTFRNPDDTSKNPTGAYLQVELNIKTLTLSKPVSPF